MADSNKALDDTRDQIKKAKEIIAKANLLLSKVEMVSQAETISLEEIMTESIKI